MAKIDPPIDLAMNGRDHGAVKVPQSFVVASASAMMLLTSSTSNVADVSSTWSSTQSHAEPISAGTVQAQPMRTSSTEGNAHLA